MTPARKRLLQRMFRLDGGLFDHELCDHDRRIMLRMARAGLVTTEESPDGFLFSVRVIEAKKKA